MSLYVSVMSYCVVHTGGKTSMQGVFIICVTLLAIMSLCCQCEQALLGWLYYLLVGLVQKEQNVGEKA